MSPQWIDSEQHASLQAPPRARYHVQTDITLPPVVHGPILISFADLNGFEFGARVRNPYRVCSCVSPTMSSLTGRHLQRRRLPARGRGTPI
jgi:hypothetical protein